MKVIKKIFVFIAIAGSFFVGSNAFAQGGNTASDTGTATASVIASLSLTNTADLAFGEGIRQDAALTVAPASGGTFTVTGEPLRFYNVTVPADATVYVYIGTGSTAQEKIWMSAFNFSTSELSSTTQGQLSAGGTDTISVGATRDAILGNQVTGAYTGPYTVSVIYQ